MYKLWKARPVLSRNAWDHLVCASDRISVPSEVQLYVRYTCDQASIGTCSYADGIVHLGLTSAYYRPTVPALAAM